MNSRGALGLLAAVAALLAWSAVAPYDRFTWWLEVAPVLIAAPVILLTWRRFPLTPLLCSCLALHAAILILGGHYTYARVPLGDWVQHELALQRNPYDRLGHFAQGFVPALAAREILLRNSVLRRGAWLFFLVTCVCLAISAAYELVEWATAESTGEAAESFLGTQGDVWDTQWDMFTALIGALCAQLALSRVHDRQIDALPRRAAT
jgi:putative membrane protein